MLFKTLNEEEEASYRQWARENYLIFSEINGVWHPIVQSECVRMNEERSELVTESPEVIDVVLL